MQGRLLYTINKYSNKDNNKTRQGHSFQKISSKLKNFIYNITKIFLLYTLNDIASFNFFQILLIQTIHQYPEV